MLPWWVELLCFRKQFSVDDAFINPMATLDGKIWLALLSLSCLLSLTLCLHSSLFFNHKLKLDDLIGNIIDGFIFFAGQSTFRSNVISKYTRGVIFLWALAASMIAGLFSGNILILLMSQEQKPPFNDLDGLSKCINAGKCTVGVTNINAILGSQLTTAIDISPGMAKVQRGIRETGSLEQVSDLEENIRRIFATSPKLYLLYCTSINADTIRNYYNEHSADKYYFLQYESVSREAIAMPKGSPLKSLLNNAINLGTRNGLFMAVYKTYFPKTDSKNFDRASNGSSVNLISFSKNIWVLLAGFLISTVGLCMEFCIRKFRKREEPSVLSIKGEDEILGNNLFLLDCLEKARTAMNIAVQGQNVPTAAKERIHEELKQLSSLIEQL